MPKDGGFKRVVRARMQKTGESYAAAKALLEGHIQPSPNLDDDGYDSFSTLQEVGVDEDDMPMYEIDGEIVNYSGAADYLVEQGLVDPELFDED
jgi:hypothetical protein